MNSSGVFRTSPTRLRLEAARCGDCGALMCPPRRVCVQCGGRDLEPMQPARTGKLLTYTVVYAAPAGFEGYAPYAAGIVELDDGLRIACQITDCPHDRLRTAMRVRLEVRRGRVDPATGAIEYAYKAVPDLVPDHRSNDGWHGCVSRVSTPRKTRLTEPCHPIEPVSRDVAEH